jgi:hypothetical protein
MTQLTHPQLLQDILNHLATNPEAKERFNLISSVKMLHEFGNLEFYQVANWFDFTNSDDHTQVYIIQTALSNTPDGVAVCDFLSVKVETTKEARPFVALNRILFQTFTTALFNGKSFETALEETNAVYLAEIN